MLSTPFCMLCLLQVLVVRVSLILLSMIWTMRTRIGSSSTTWGATNWATCSLKRCCGSWSSPVLRRQTQHSQQQVRLSACVRRATAVSRATGRSRLMDQCGSAARMCCGNRFGTIGSRSRQPACQAMLVQARFAQY